MKEILNFLIKISKLKEIPRTGLIWLGVKKPETVAEHTFIIAFAAWLLGKEKKLDIEKLIKISLSHDICEVFAGDMTPFWGLLPKDEEKRKEILKRWIRFPIKEKEERARKKFKVEENALLKLIKPLKEDIRKEILTSWLNYEKKFTKEGKFAKQIDQIMGMIEAICHLDVKKRAWITPWWEEAEETIDDPLLLEFLKVIQKKFYGWKVKYLKELESILDLLLEIGKLKKLPRRIWHLLGVKDPLETVAGHVFSVSLMAWIFGREKKELNMERLLKMALCHEIAAVYTNDLTPYDTILAKGGEKKEIFKKWLHLPRKEKEKIHFQHYKKERKALKKLTLKLRNPFKKEIIRLFDEYRTVSSAEARFLNQVNAMSVLLQALLYWKKDKKLQIDWMWEWALEKCEDPIILEFLDALKEKFY